MIEGFACDGEAGDCLNAHIRRGKGLLEVSVLSFGDLMKSRSEMRSWSQRNRVMLVTMFHNRSTARRRRPGQRGHGVCPARHCRQGRGIPPSSSFFDTAAAGGAQPTGRVRDKLDRSGTFAPVAVAPRWDDGRLAGEVAGTGDVAAVSRQVARVFSLDHDGTGFQELGRRDPALAPILAAFR